MCGLVGFYSSNMQNKHKDALATLLFFDTLRGRDSTGVAALRHNADTAVLKSTVPGYEFIDSPKFDQHLKLTDFCWIGHNRFGTVGKNIKTNAHPFEVLDDDGCVMLVGAHNGTLRNKWELTDHQKFGTDSEALFNSICHEGVEKTVAKLDTDGTWALIWYDHVEEELRILRNKERTLFYGFEKGKKTLMWASEAWMLRVAAMKHNIEFEDDKVWAFTEDTLFRLPVPLKYDQELTMERKGGLVGKTKTFFQQSKTGGQDRTKRETQTWTPPKKSQTTPRPLTGNYSQSGQQEQSPQKDSTAQSGTKTSDTGEKQHHQNGGTSNGQQKNDNALLYLPNSRKYKGFSGELLTKREIEDQLENGCAWCETEFICLEDRFAWLAPERPICHKCLQGIEEEPEAAIEIPKSQIN